MKETWSRKRSAEHEKSRPEMINDERKNDDFGDNGGDDVENARESKYHNDKDSDREDACGR